MAQKVSITMVSDLSGAEGDDISSVRFALDGTEYEIDLTQKEAAKLTKSLEAYIGAARRVRGARSGRRSAATSDGPSAAAIREWARANGVEVTDRGRVSVEARAAYAAAH